MSVLSRPYFHDEAAAFAQVESVLWADGIVCPHCGNVEGFYDLGKTRIGLKKCAACRKQFTVRVGTIFEDSHLPLHKWLQAIHLVCSSKKGISAHQLHRVLEVTYKTAWFLEHRIREAMRVGDLPPMGGVGKTLEADTTYVGGANPTSTRTSATASAAVTASRSSIRWSSAAAGRVPTISRTSAARPFVRY
jgi:transposase-like protein